MIKGWTEYVTYVLRLEENRWYVGLTTRLNYRLSQHWHGSGAKWTELYKPIELVELYSGDQEQLVTDQYINEYGFGLVRGGNYTAVRDVSPREQRRRIGRAQKRNTKGEKMTATEVGALFGHHTHAT